MITEPSVSSSGFEAPGKPPLHSLAVNGGGLFNACHGDDAVDVLAAAIAAALIRGPRGGSGRVRRSACASARPDQASAATMHVHDVADFIGDLALFVVLRERHSAE